MIFILICVPLLFVRTLDDRFDGLICFHRLFHSQIMRFDTSMDSLVNVTRSESVTDLNSELSNLPHARRSSTGHARNDENNFLSTPPKPFGIGKNYYSDMRECSLTIINHLFIINFTFLFSSIIGNKYPIETESVPITFYLRRRDSTDLFRSQF